MLDTNSNHSMNHVNLIGKVTSEPKFTQLENGRKVAKVSLATKEFYLDADGNMKSRSNWHILSAWGKWIKVLEEFGTVGTQVAVEGRLVSRFYNTQGQKKFVSEVEINDLILL
jgi:single-strand DNA-binding protein